MAGQEISGSECDEAGLIGDRRWCLVDELTGEIVGGKRFANIMKLSSKFTKPPTQRGVNPSVEISFPDGYTMLSNHADMPALLKAFVGHPVSLRPLSADDDFFRRKVEASPAATRQSLGLGPNGAIEELASFPLKMLNTLGKYVTPSGVLHDAYPLHFVTSATLNWLQQETPTSNIDAKRFRPSFEIETLDHLTGEVEKDWTECFLKIGGCLIQVMTPTIRCSMPAQAQPGLEKDPEIGVAIRTTAQQYVGSYAKVIEKGKIKVGDTVTYHPTSEFRRIIKRTIIGMKKPLIGFALGAAEKSWNKKQLNSAQKSVEEKLTNQGFASYNISKVEEESFDVKSFYLQPKDGSSARPCLAGQHMVLALPCHSDKPLIRSYSISHFDPKEGYRITVKRELAPAQAAHMEAGQGSGYLHDQVKQGMTLHAKGPAGSYYLHPLDERPLVLISIGVGITPMISMASTALKKNPDRQILFLHGTRNSSSQTFRIELQALKASAKNLHTHLFFSNPLPEDQEGKDYQVIGRISHDAIKTAVNLPGAAFYICGTQGFMEETRDDLCGYGVSPEDVHIEYFKKQRNMATGAKSHEVTFVQSGIRTVWEPEAGTLLDLAEEVGLQPEFGCRYGTCEACTATLIEGEVTHESGVVAPDKHTVLLCSCVPTSDIRLDL